MKLYSSSIQELNIVQNDANNHISIDVLDILSDTAVKLLELSPAEDIYTVIANGLKKLVRNTLILIFSFESSSGMLCLRTITGNADNYMASVMRRHPINVSVPISKSARKSLLTGRLAHILGGLHLFTTSTYAPHGMAVIKDLLNNQGFYAIGFTWKKQLFGGAAFISTGDIPINAAVIEAFVRQVSIALQRRQAEEALRQSESRYREFVQSSNSMIFSSDIEGNILFANQALANNLGYSPAEIKGTSCLDFVHSGDFPEIQNKFVSLVEGKNIEDMELRYRRRDGSYITTLNSATPIMNSDGEIVSIIGVAHDISGRIKKEKELRDYGSHLEKLVRRRTEELESVNRKLLRELAEKKRTEDELRKTSERLDKLMSLAPVMICRVDLKMKIQYVNKKIEDVTGYKAEELIGKYWPALGGFTAKDSKVMMKRVVQRLLGRPSRPLQVKLKRKDGGWIFVSGIGDFIRENGVPVGIQVIGQDINDYVLARKEAKRSTDRLLKALDGIIQAMATTVEMRDPYTAGHQRRVARLAGMIAREIGLSRDQINGIELAGLIHDLGKIKIPAEILTHPSTLCEAEMNIIKTHPVVGYDILKNIEFPWPVACIVLQHHERMDGSGYPYGIRGEEILLEAKILAVADVVEAIASHRPYRAALGVDSALAEISKNKGRLYDPEVVDACVKIFKNKGFTFERV